MKIKIRARIEDVRIGDIEPKTGKAVVSILRRFDALWGRWYVRATLEGGWPILDGYIGQTKVDVIRKEGLV